MKGRFSEPHAKLTVSQVREVRASIARGQTQTAVAKELGVNPSTISDIITGKHWSKIV
jgi:plasmid maintenance system antidote protein VapI